METSLSVRASAERERGRSADSRLEQLAMTVIATGARVRRCRDGRSHPGLLAAYTARVTPREPIRCSWLGHPERTRPLQTVRVVLSTESARGGILRDGAG
ncbi:unnamed protein product [Lampetra fluviatilis]